MNKNRVTRLVLSVVVGVIAAAAIGYLQSRGAGQAQGEAGYIGRAFGGDFAGLMDHDGRVLERDSFHGKYQLVFFGFTHCPAVCPAELQKITYVLKNLPAEKRTKLQPLLITVDPERDTPETLKSYLSVFDPAITGITGRRERIDQVVSDWKIYAARVPLEDGGYTMDHSAFLYLRDPDGRLRGVYPSEDTPADLLAAIGRQIDG